MILDNNVLTERFNNISKEVFQNIFKGIAKYIFNNTVNNLFHAIFNYILNANFNDIFKDAIIRNWYSRLHFAIEILKGQLGHPGQVAGILASKSQGILAKQLNDAKCSHLSNSMC